MARYVKEDAKYTVLEVVAAAIILAENKTNEEFTAKYPNVYSILEGGDSLPLDRAQEMISTVTNGIVLRVLKGLKVNGFYQSLNALLQNPAGKVGLNKLSLLSYAPDVNATMIAAEELTNYAYDSKYVGNVGDSIVVTLKILRCHFIASYSFYSAVGIDKQGNMYTFIPKKMIKSTTDYSYKIKAKIKIHVVDANISNAQVTRLNYVKILSEE